MKALIVVIPFLAFTLAGAPAAAQPEMPAPGPEHERMKAWAGEFTLVVKAWMAPDQDPMESKGSATIKLAMNGFFLIDDTKGDMMGMEFVGHGITGYDPNKKKYVGTWVDSMGPWMLNFEGTWDEKSKALTTTGDMFNPQDGKISKIRMVTTHPDADHATFEFHAPGPDGKEFKAMEIAYTRKK